MLRSHDDSPGVRGVSPDEKKEKATWEIYVEKESFKPGVKE